MPQPKDFAERAALASKALQELNLDVDVWIDDEGDQSRALFGDLPHSAIVLDDGGTIRAKLSWCDPKVLASLIPEVPDSPLIQSAGPVDSHFLTWVAAERLPGIDDRTYRHHRDVMLAWLIEHEREHADRSAWIDELAGRGPQHQRDWLARQRDALAIPPGEDPHRWTKDIERFLASDRERPPAPGSVVFVGSSSIRLWDSLAEDMAPLPIVQRGFGGSRLFDACYWSRELVGKHLPSVVVVFSGTNDIAGERPKSAARVFELFELLVARVRRAQPRVPICYIAITPTEARRRHLEIVRAANRRIRAACDRDPLLTFVDPTADLSQPDGSPDPRFFRGDRLHLNAAGYAIWTRHVRPVVERLYGTAANGR